jgi:hypothetical protein
MSGRTIRSRQARRAWQPTPLTSATASPEPRADHRVEERKQNFVVPGQTVSGSIRHRGACDTFCAAGVADHVRSAVMIRRGAPLTLRAMLTAFRKTSGSDSRAEIDVPPSSSP